MFMFRLRTRNLSKEEIIDHKIISKVSLLTLGTDKLSLEIEKKAYRLLFPAVLDWPPSWILLEPFYLVACAVCI